VTRRSRRPAAERVNPGHLRVMETELRRAWAQRQAPHGPQPEDGAAEDAAGQSPASPVPESPGKNA
jgi:hypothetical protein